MDQNIKEKDRFSPQKKYAVLRFNCQDKEIGIRVSDALRDQLLDFSFNIIDKEKVQKILADAGLSEEEVVQDYSKALWKLKDINAIIIGDITLNRALSSGGLIASSSSGGYNDHINRCVVYVVEISSGEIIGSAEYSARTLSSTSSTISPSQVAEKLARILSPH